MRGEVWRLILVENGSAQWNMAVDEAVLEARTRDLVPNTLRLYFFSPSAVTIGYFQKIREAVDLEYAESMKIDVVRRITGGGAVYHDERGEVTYSVVLDEASAPGDVVESYEYICRGLVAAIERFGLKARFVPVNDITVNGKKISGSAQIRRRGSILQHGTLMYDTDIYVLGRILRVPEEKLRAHGADSIYSRVTTLSRELGRKVGRRDVVENMIEGFKEALGIELRASPLTGWEREKARELVEAKYSRREWNYRR